MKRIAYIFLLTALVLGFNACTKLDIAPLNVVQDEDVFKDNSGIQSYMARVYSELPIEDFRYSPQRGYNNFWLVSPFPAMTGEAISRDQRGVTFDSQADNPYWAQAYTLIREANYFMETLPKYADNFSASDAQSWLGEMHFIRAFTYFALVKRYGGVPIVNHVLSYPGVSLQELQIPRAAEQAVYDSIAADLDYAIANLGEGNQAGRANKYAAAAFKSRAMLFAGSIAKYNDPSNQLTDNGILLCGIPAEKANDYFKASYDAAKMLEGKYSLYKSKWSADDKDAQYQNFISLFFDANSTENIFVKQYSYPQSVHGYDVYNVPAQSTNGGYGAEVAPTLNFVEMFDGLQKNADGKIQTLDANNKYLMFDKTMDLFANAEPRLRATVIFPGDDFKGESIEIRRGIYTGPVAGGISPLLPAGSTDLYPTTNIVSSAKRVQTPYKLPDGTLMNPAGLSGVFTADDGNISGFSVRKYLNPNMPKVDVQENKSAQTWIEIRYAEVLLNRAEAAEELDAAGQGATYHQDAVDYVNMIRERAGANPYAGGGMLRDTVRQERKKELAFENKIWWDMRRWRTADKEQQGTVYRTLMPFYAANSGKYFFDARLDERNVRYTFDPRGYYMAIPGSAITKSPNLVQNKNW